MPDGGYPLMIYFHGSGGLSSAAVDMGRSPTADAPGEKGKGPAWVVAPHGFAIAASALPVNPERLPGAAETAYLNFNNPAAFRDTFRQGVIEQRLFLAALRGLEIPPATLASCSGPTLPASATSYHFDPDKLVAQGQSMGGMYTNLISAVEPRIKASVPTGAGGYWTYFIPKTTLISNVAGSIGLLFGIRARPASCTRRCTCSRPRGRRSTRWSRCRGSRTARCPAIPCARSTSRWATATRTSRP